MGWRSKPKTLAARLKRERVIKTGTYSFGPRSADWHVKSLGVLVYMTDGYTVAVLVEDDSATAYVRKGACLDGMASQTFEGDAETLVARLEREAVIDTIKFAPPSVDDSVDWFDLLVVMTGGYSLVVRVEDDAVGVDVYVESDGAA